MLNEAMISAPSGNIAMTNHITSKTKFQEQIPGINILVDADYLPVHFRNI